MAKMKIKAVAGDQNQEPVIKKATAKKSIKAKKKTIKPKENNKTTSIPDPIWEKWPNETAEQYLKFCVYRDMAYTGGIDEIVTEGYSALVKKKKRCLDKLPKLLGLNAVAPFARLSIKYQWQKRVEEYDAFLEMLIRKENEAAIVSMVAKHAKLGEKMVQKAVQRFENIPEDKITASDAARMADIGVRIERLSRGQSTDNQQINGTMVHGGAVRIKNEPEQDLSQLSDEELEQLEKLLEKAQVKQNG